MGSIPSLPSRDNFLRYEVSREGGEGDEGRSASGQLEIGQRVFVNLKFKKAGTSQSFSADSADQGPDERQVKRGERGGRGGRKGIVLPRDWASTLSI